VTISLEAQPARPATLTTSQLDALVDLWRLAELAPVTGYGISILAMAGASNQALADALTSVDLDDTDSVRSAVKALLQWRQKSNLHGKVGAIP
jgi:hypothetical protein